MNDKRGRPAPLVLVRLTDTDCPVCGLGGAFAAARHYDTCPRCDWVDDPASYADPERKSETNADSLNDAKRSWPERLAVRLAEAPLSSFRLMVRDDAVGDFDYLIDGVPGRTLFPSGAWDLKAAVGPWPAAGDWFAPLRTGTATTRTGRSRLSVCELCGGDDYELSITADLHVYAERVVWCRIGFETYDYSSGDWNLDVRSAPAGFAFDAGEYGRALSGVTRDGTSNHE